MVERNEVSVQEVKAFLALSRAPAWLTNAELAHMVDGVAARTIRAYTLKFVKLGIADQAELFPAHKYRFSQMASKRNRAYVQRLMRAAEIYGLTATQNGGRG